MRKLAYIFCIALFISGCATDFSKIEFPKLEEKVPRVKLGVKIHKITPALAEVFSLKDNKGVLVGDFIHGGLAAKAGIKRGDVIVEYNGLQVSNNIEFLARMVSQTTPNTNISLVVIRDGKPISLDIYSQIPGSSQPSSPALPPVAKAPPQSQQPPQAVESVYSGTGFLFSAKDYVITNWHVVRGTNNIKVKFLNGEKIEAEVALKDPQNDIAFLKLARQPQLPPSDLKIGDSSKMRMGDKVFTIGYPAHRLMGDNPKYTEGVVNAISGLQDDPTVFQISVQIQPGNSGGPLFNSSGEVIGITQASLDPKAAVEAFGTLPQNVNYAIKSTYISALLPMLPQTLIASRGIMVVPTEPKNTLANFIEKAKKNIVLIEAKE
jgi:S1-C subfamily serine protease